MGSKALPFLHQEAIVVRRSIASTSVLLAVLLTACSGQDESEPRSPAPPLAAEPSPTVCAEECSNQEVADSGCDAGQPRTVNKPAEVSPSKLRGIGGVLELRMADPAVCESLFWARFRPYKETNEPWSVVITVSGRPREEQSSLPGDPTVDGYTEGVYVTPGSDITYCVTQNPGKNKMCMQAHVNQGGG